MIRLLRGESGPWNWLEGAFCPNRLNLYRLIAHGRTWIGIPGQAPSMSPGQKRAGRNGDAASISPGGRARPLWRPAFRPEGVFQPQLARRPLDPVVCAVGSAPLDAHPQPPGKRESGTGAGKRDRGKRGESESGESESGTGTKRKRDRYDIDKMGSFGLCFGYATDSEGSSWWNGFSRLESRRGANAVVRESGRLPSIRAGFAGYS